MFLRHFGSSPVMKCVEKTKLNRWIHFVISQSVSDEEVECGGIFQWRVQTLSELMVFKSGPQAGETQNVSCVHCHHPLNSALPQ